MPVPSLEIRCCPTAEHARMKADDAEWARCKPLGTMPGEVGRIELRNCYRCHDTLAKPAAPEPCPVCGGWGVKLDVNGRRALAVLCGGCAGEGVR